MILLDRGSITDEILISSQGSKHENTRWKNYPNSKGFGMGMHK